MNGANKGTQGAPGGGNTAHSGRPSAAAGTRGSAAATITVHPGGVGGDIRVPGSKSITHRAYVLAARSDRPVTVAAPLRAADPDATLASLHGLGAHIVMERGAVTFEPATWHPPHAVLDCRNAGTTLRLLLAQCAIEPFPCILDGDASLRSRPNGPLLEALAALGAAITSEGGRCPVRVQGPIQAGEVELPARTSSQFASALLLALPLLAGPSTVRMQPPLRSAPYLAITRRVLHDFGIAVAWDDQVSEAQVSGGSVPRCPVFRVPADWSTAAFPLAAAAVTGGKVHVQGPRADDPQGDRAISDMLRRFGAKVRIHDDSVEAEGGPLESPGALDVADTPDLFPALCAVAAVARGTTTFTGGEALRTKESDRISAMAAGLRAMGIDAEERPDGLVVHGTGPGRRPRGATISSRGDHRIHMAFAVLALAADGPSTLDEPDCVRVSYPSFHADLAAMQEAA